MQAGIVSSLSARTSVLAAANPRGGHYDRGKTIIENLRMSAALLSRFDLIYILLDKCVPRCCCTRSRARRAVQPRRGLRGRLAACAPPHRPHRTAPCVRAPPPPEMHARTHACTLKAFPDRLCLYHDHNMVASHPRSYERHRDFENPDHVRELLDQRRRARDAKWLLTFYSLSPQAEHYHQQLSARSLNARVHINKIVALADIYGADKVALAIDDAIASEAFASQYIENILQQRERHTPQPGPLHLTRRSDLLDLELSPADLSLYDKT